jgi:hypothetical protein
VTDATTNLDALRVIQSHVKAIGKVSKVVIGEPKKGMQNGVVAVIPMTGRVDEVTLQTMREIHVVMLRRYENMLREPQEQVEFDLDRWRAQIAADLAGDFTIGGEVAYLLPTEIEWRWGYAQIETLWHRILEFEFAYRIDDRATFAP